MGPLRSIKQDVPFNDQVISATTESRAVDVGSCEGPISFQVIWSGGVAPTMACELQVSNDKVNWDTYSGSSFAITTVSGTSMYDIVATGCEYFRVKVTVTSGSATFKVLFNGKSRG